MFVLDTTGKYIVLFLIFLVLQNLYINQSLLSSDIYRFVFYFVLYIFITNSNRKLLGKLSNAYVIKKLLGDDFPQERAPIVLDEYANTSSAGSIIAFHKNNSDINAGEVGVICSFGAGYSVGSVVLRKL